MTITVTEKTVKSRFTLLELKKIAIRTVVIAAAFIGLLYLLQSPLSPDSTRYSMMYNTTSDHVHSDKRPRDCDWDHAPIGSKDCHYEKRVSAFQNSQTKQNDVYITWEKVKE